MRSLRSLVGLLALLGMGCGGTTKSYIPVDSPLVKFSAPEDLGPKIEKMPQPTPASKTETK